jgi:hypothetical protein
MKKQLEQLTQVGRKGTSPKSADGSILASIQEAAKANTSDSEGEGSGKKKLSTTSTSSRDKSRG